MIKFDISGGERGPVAADCCVQSPHQFEWHTLGKWWRDAVIRNFRITATNRKRFELQRHNPEANSIVRLKEPSVAATCKGYLQVRVDSRACALQTEQVIPSKTHRPRIQSTHITRTIVINAQFPNAIGYHTAGIDAKRANNIVGASASTIPKIKYRSVWCH